MVRLVLAAVVFGAGAWAQTMTEAAGIAAGSSVGSVAGKQVSKGITGILSKTGKQLETAAKDTKQTTRQAPLLLVGPGVPQQQPYNVPPPPPLPPSVSRRATLPAPRVPVAPAPVVGTVATPPPAMTSADLAAVAVGMGRNDVLRMGVPSARLTMNQDGHLMETFRYRDAQGDVGAVRLTDGAVARVEIQR